MEDKVTLELSWDDYQLLLASIQTHKNMFEFDDRLDDLYIKLYIERKITKGRE